MRLFFHKIEDFWHNLPLFVRLWGVGVVLAAVALAVFGPGYRHFREWRTDRNFAAAKVAMDDKRAREARDLTLSVLRSGRQDIEVFRLLEESLRELGDAWHPQVAMTLVTMPGQTREDRLNGFRGVAKESPLGLVGQVWNQLEEEDQRQPGFAEAFADRLIRDERWNEAVIVLGGVPESAFSSAGWLRFARVLAALEAPENIVEAQRILARYPPSSEKSLGLWLDVIEAIPTRSVRKDILENSVVMDALAAAAAAGDARAAMAHLRIEYPGSDSQAREAHEQALEVWGPEHPLAVARLLIAGGREQDMMDFALAHTGPLEAELVHLVHRGLMARGEPQSALAWVDRHAESTPLHEREALRMIALTALESADRVEAWSLAMDEASTVAPGNGFLTLYRLAADAGLEREAEQAMLAAIRLSRGPLPLFESLRPLVMSLADRGQELLLLDLLTVYLAMEPSNPVLLSQYAYLATLNGLAAPELVLGALAPLDEKLADELPFQFVMAAVLACAGDFEAAALRVGRYEDRFDELAPQNQAILLVIRVRTGELAPDAPEIRSFQWRALQPSERRKFSELIGEAVEEEP